LEKEIEVLQKQDKIRHEAMKKAEKDLLKKQTDLDQSIEEVMVRSSPTIGVLAIPVLTSSQDWVPKAIVESHNKRDSAYQLLRKANLQLIELQQKLGVPRSISFTEYEPDKNTAHEDVDATTDISILLGQELIKSKVRISSQLIPINPFSN